MSLFRRSSGETKASFSRPPLYLGVVIGCATGATDPEGASIPTDEYAPKGAAVLNGAAVPKDADVLNCSAASKDVTFSKNALSPKAEATEANAVDIEDVVASRAAK